MQRLPPQFNFYINKSFWRRWGHGAALPFRLKNLIDLQDVLGSFGIISTIYGRTLRDAVERGALRPDHDDDLMLSSPLEVLSPEIYGQLNRVGFEVIRQAPEMVSVIRYERYIDIHPVKHQFPATEEVVVNGHSLLASTNREQIVREKYGPVSDRQTVVSPTKGVEHITTAKGRRRLLRTLGRLARKALGVTQPGASRLLSEDEFLGLKIDHDGATNWTWRAPHMNQVFRRGESLRDTLVRLRGNPRAVEEGLVENQLDRFLPEPINLSRHFWQMGNNFFAYSVKYGFRHGVLPYQAANLYISAGLLPRLYSKEYFESLPRMTEQEIALMLHENPIGIKNGAVSSGRHRVSAMLGRMVGGDKYIPFQVVDE